MSNENLYEKIEQLEHDLLVAYEEKAKEHWAEDALNSICGDFEDIRWDSDRMDNTINQIAKALGGRIDAELLILYLFGRLYEIGRVKIELNERSGNKILSDYDDIYYGGKTVSCVKDNGDDDHDDDELKFSLV